MQPPSSELPHSPAKEKKGGLLGNLVFNIILPTAIMTKLSSEDYLGPLMAIVVALIFPIGYGIRDYLTAHKPNFFSILGVVSVILTGTMSLLKLPPEYIAIKEAAIPGLFGLATLLSVNTRWPLVRTFLFNEQVMKVQVVHDALAQHGTEQAFELKLRNASYMVAASFFLSSVLNYVLAKVILVSEPGTVAYTEELGKMTALSFPVIALPSTLVMMIALGYLLKQIKALTHLDLEDVFHS
ncbi:MAG: MFS transporter [Hahellaceae bacterium]|nr:MFS transporter [Hahellaceae bacterium]